MKLQLIPEWKQAWKYWSVRIMAVMVVLPQAAQLFDAETRAGMPMWLSTTISVLSFLGLVARLVGQGNVTIPKDPPA